MKIEYIHPDKLIRDDENNPNSMTKPQLEALAESIKRVGFIYPLVINKNNKILQGHQRHTASNMLNLQEVPCVRKENLTEEEELLFTQIANKLHGKHDKAKDIEIFKKLLKTNNEKFLSAINGRPINFLIDNLKTFTPDKVKTRVKSGDTWKLDNHTLYCGDASSYTPDCNVILSDPPYGIDVVDDAGDLTGMTSKAQNKYKKVIGDNKPFDPSHILSLNKKTILFGGNYYSDKLPAGRWMVWIKKSPEHFGNKTSSDAELIWSNMPGVQVRAYYHLWDGLARAGKRVKRVHPNQKPIELINEIITKYTAESDVIYDPYGGSGTTLLSCEQTKRTCIICEIDPEYCDIIISRWENTTGKKALKIHK